MIIEQLLYRNNHLDFLDKMKDAVIDRFVFDTDENPTFDKTAIPFAFRYCFAVTIYSDNGNFKLHTFMANNGIETIWFSPAVEKGEGAYFIPVNAKVKNIDIKDGHDGYPFKLQFEFERTKLIFYAADIFPNNDDGIDYVINDEMILAFEQEDEALHFENAAGFKA